jgi:hypothetical protein
VTRLETLIQQRRDLIITKAAGLIVSEVLARGRPLVIVDPIPGQEEWNADTTRRGGPWITSLVDADRRLIDQVASRHEHIALVDQIGLLQRCLPRLLRPVERASAGRAA